MTVKRTKICISCKEEKPLNCFPKDNRPDGRKDQCKICWCQYMAKYRKKHPEQIKKTQEKYRKKHKEKDKDYFKNYYKEHPDLYKKSRKKYYEKIKQIVFNHYGSVCVCCGEREQKFLTIDHKNNDGANFRNKKGIKGNSIFFWIIRNNFPNSLQILCWNCNYGKYLGDGICPHQERRIK